MTIEMSNTSKEQKVPPPPPETGPYLFPIILAIFGLWCLYDGWFTSNPDMNDHQLFNRLGSYILLPWSAIDFYHTWKSERADKSVDNRNQ